MPTDEIQIIIGEQKQVKVHGLLIIYLFGLRARRSFRNRMSNLDSGSWSKAN